MKFGISTFVTDQGVTPTVLGPAVEERGFDSLFIAEHTHIPVERRTPYPFGGEMPEKYYRTLDPFVALTAAAVVTERLLLGTGITLVVQRDPIITAKEVASLDLVSGGRAIFGVGVGWLREEIENHGTDPAVRGRLVNERLRAIRELWTKEKAEFHGEFVDFDPVYSWPKPVQRPHPPIYVGGGEAAFPRIAELGDAWIANVMPPEELRRRMERLHGMAHRDVTVTMAYTPADPELLEGFRKVGVDRVLLNLETMPERESLAQLDRFSAVTARFR
ncbi:LLM class F420-dependent oxidoreductase [Streptantibioticus ferralitis]|uniref:LLM class F420-dependent oxidoreductase n=1 Tax=Streptantibioticus ferralitis TaxID=236510 RepID=A0ABT5YZ12_9ACTN|nr:LLM class F420-dependent oxidoreductase [Streptantibioticus ferralitis]MDF2256728.1 LLM class F420-dependent oxidoreductase [Streptantibioticus ferralitis]